MYLLLISAGIFDSNAHTQKLAFKDSMRVAKLGDEELHAGVEEGKSNGNLT